MYQTLTQPGFDVQPDVAFRRLRIVGGTDRHVDPVAELTPREREVLSLIAEGRSNVSICEELYISPKTLERHVQHIFTKLDLPPSADHHRRVRAVLLWLASPISAPVGEVVAV